LLNALAAIGLGVLHSGLWGLVAARHLGQLANLKRLGAQIVTLRGAGLQNLAQIKDVLRAYRKFPLFTLPYSLVGSFSREFLVLALLAFHEPAAAGLYAMARSVLLAPSNLLAGSLSQVFYKEAAEHGTDAHFRHFTYCLFLILGGAGAMGFAFVALWNGDLFRLVLGARWSGAGPYAALIAPFCMLAMLTSWPERIFEVRGRQNLSFYLQIVMDSVMVLSVLTVLWRGASPWTGVAVYGAFMVVYHLLYLGLVFRLAALRAWQYLALLGVMAAGAALVFAVHALLQLAIGQSLFLLLAEGALVALFCLAGLLAGVKMANIRL
jgi:O-antigen/teichoic acid export membrane protein